MASWRPNGVSLVPFDSPDPPVSKRCIDFSGSRWKGALLLPSSLSFFRRQDFNGAALAGVQ